VWLVPHCDWGAHLQFSLRKLILAASSASSAVPSIHPRIGQLPLKFSSGRSSWEPPQATDPKGTPNAFDTSWERTCRDNCHRNIYRVLINEPGRSPGSPNLHVPSGSHVKVSGIGALTWPSSTLVILARAVRNLLLIWCATARIIFVFCGVIICCQSHQCCVCAFSLPIQVQSYLILVPLKYPVEIGWCVVLAFFSEQGRRMR